MGKSKIQSYGGGGGGRLTFIDWTLLIDHCDCKDFWNFTILVQQFDRINWGIGIRGKGFSNFQKIEQLGVFISEPSQVSTPGLLH